MNIVTALRVGARMVPFMSPVTLWRVWEVSRLRTAGKGSDADRARRLIDTHSRQTQAAFKRAQALGPDAMYVVIPCHNEMNSLPALLVALSRNAGVVPVVVNNRSDDDTPVVAQKMGALVIDQPTGRKMAATQHGMRYVRQTFGAKRIIFTDGDGLPLPYWAKTITGQLKHLDTGKGAAVFGTAIFNFGVNRRADVAITVVGLLLECMRMVRGELPIARGHNYGVSFDDNGAIEAALGALNPDTFASSKQALPDDELILQTIHRTGALVRYMYSAKTWVVTSNDRMTKVSDALAMLRTSGASYNDVTTKSYQDEYRGMDSKK